MKRKRKNACPSPLLDDSPKRTKVHAQRKFAQGSNVNSPVITPIKELETDIPTIEALPEPVELLPIKRPNTEDFLTFLCFRGTPILPPNLNFFNTASIVDTNGQVHEIKSESPKNGPIDIAKCGNSSEKPFIAFGVRKRADPIVISKQMDRKRRHALALQALRRKYQEQKMAKIRALAISKLSEKVTNKTLVKTNTVSKTETVTKKSSTLQKTKVVATKHIKVTTQTLKTTLRPKINQKMCLRSFRGRFIQRELPFRNKIVSVPEKKIGRPLARKVETLRKKRIISEEKLEPEAEGMPKPERVKPSVLTTPKVVKKSTLESSASVSSRTMRSGVIHKAVTERMKQKRLLMSNSKPHVKSRSLRSTTMKKTVLSRKKSRLQAQQKLRTQQRKQLLLSTKSDIKDEPKPQEKKIQQKGEASPETSKCTEIKKDFKKVTDIKKESSTIDEKNKKQVNESIDIRKEISKSTDIKKRNGKVVEIEKNTRVSRNVRKETTKIINIKKGTKKNASSVKSPDSSTAKQQKPERSTRSKDEKNVKEQQQMPNTRTRKRRSSIGEPLSPQTKAKSNMSEVVDTNKKDTTEIDKAKKRGSTSFKKDELYTKVTDDKPKKHISSISGAKEDFSKKEGGIEDDKDKPVDKTKPRKKSRECSDKLEDVQKPETEKPKQKRASGNKSQEDHLKKDVDKEENKEKPKRKSVSTENKNQEELPKKESIKVEEEKEKPKRSSADTNTTIDKNNQEIIKKDEIKSVEETEKQKRKCVSQSIKGDNPSKHTIVKQEGELATDKQKDLKKDLVKEETEEMELENTKESKTSSNKPKKKSGIKCIKEDIKSEVIEKKEPVNIIDNEIKKKDNAPTKIEEIETTKDEAPKKQDEILKKKELCKKDEMSKKQNELLKKIEDLTNVQQELLKKKEEAAKKQEELPKKKEETAKTQEELPKKKEETAKKQEELPKKKEATAKEQEKLPNKEEEAAKEQEVLKKKDDLSTEIAGIPNKEEEICEKKDEVPKKQQEVFNKKDVLKTTDDASKEIEDIPKQKEEICKKKDEASKKQQEVLKKKEVFKTNDDASKEIEDIPKKKEEMCNKKDETLKKQQEFLKRKEVLKTKDDAFKEIEDIPKKKEEICKKKDEALKKQQEVLKKKDVFKTKDDASKEIEGIPKKKEEICKKDEAPRKQQEVLKKKEVFKAKDDASKQIETIPKKKEEICRKKDETSKNQQEVSKKKEVFKTKDEVSKEIEGIPKKKEEVCKKKDEAPKKHQEVLKKKEIFKTKDETIKEQDEIPSKKDGSPKKVDEQARDDIVRKKDDKKLETTKKKENPTKKKPEILKQKQEMPKKKEEASKKKEEVFKSKETELSPKPQRPSRKTKEAAAIYMEILSHKLVHDSQIDDDNVSIDSFPELPNVKRTEQRENELKAQAKKDDTKLKLKESDPAAAGEATNTTKKEPKNTTQKDKTEKNVKVECDEPLKTTVSKTTSEAKIGATEEEKHKKPESTIVFQELNLPKKNVDEKISKRQTRNSVSLLSKSESSDGSDQSFHLDIKVPRQKKITRSKTLIKSTKTSEKRAPPSMVNAADDFGFSESDESTSDINLQALVNKVKKKKFSKTKSKKSSNSFSDSDEEPLSKLTNKSVDDQQVSNKPKSKCLDEPESSGKAKPSILKPEIEDTKIDNTKPKRECAKRPQNYLPMFSSSDDDDIFIGFDEKKEKTDPISSKSCSHAPPLLDFFTKDIGRRFGKEKINMSNEQIEKWLTESALAGNSVKKENDEMLKFGEKIPTETTLEINESIDTVKLKSSLLQQEVKTESRDPLKNVESPVKKQSCEIKQNDPVKPQPVDRKLIFRKSKIENIPNINAFSPENESSVYAFGEENEEIISTPFRRPSRRPSSTATSRSEDEFSKNEDSSKSGHFRKPAVKQDVKCIKDEPDLTPEAEEGTSSFYIPQKPSKSSYSKQLSVNRKSSEKSLSKSKSNEKVLDVDDFKYKVPSSPSASSSSSAKLYKRQTYKPKSRTNELPSPVYMSDFPKVTDPARLVEAPTFHPTDQEFQDPLEYIERIRHKAEQFGICRIVPPTSFKPDCKVSDDMRFTAYNQYVHKMFQRWGPNFKELMAIKKYLETQNINITHPPWIGGMEIDLPRLYQTVQNLGGLKEVIEKKRWPRVSELMKIPKSAQDRVTKLDDIYCKYLLPYDTLSPAEREKLFDEVETEWAKRESKSLLKAQEKVINEESTVEGDSEPEDNEAEECITKGRNMALNAFYRIARNTMSMYFKTQEPPAQEVEQEYWNYVMTKQNHICVHSGSIDSGSWGYGFAISKNSPFARHPWNLKVLTNNTSSLLRSLGPVMGVTVPTLHVGMVFSACCWYRDPHGLPWIEYLHTGASKIWYGIPNCMSDSFHSTIKKLVPNYSRNKELWLPSDTVMVPPSLLVDNNVSLCRTVQDPGQFIVVFPKVFTSSLSTGYVVSESVYFAPAYWLKTARALFDSLRNSSEPSMFSLDRLLLSIASDARCNAEILRQVIPHVQELCDKEKTIREKLKSFGEMEMEKLAIPEVSKNKKRKLHQAEEGDYECDICRASLFISVVFDVQDGLTYCLEHAVEVLEAKKIESAKCKLIVTYDEEDLSAVPAKMKALMDNKLQKKGAK